MTSTDGNTESSDRSAIQTAPLPTDALLASRLIRLASNLRDRRNALSASLGLQEGQDRFLLIMMANDGLPMGSLAAAIPVSASSATKIIMKLEEKGLVRREASRIDSRQNHAYLTEAGQEMAANLSAGYASQEAEFTANLKPKDAERLVKLLDMLDAALGGRDRAAAIKAKKAGKAKPGTSASKPGGKAKKKQKNRKKGAKKG